MQYRNRRYGKLSELRFYAAGVPLEELARTLLRSKRCVRDWIDGARLIPYWVPELLRLRQLEHEVRMREIMWQIPPCERPAGPRALWLGPVQWAMRPAANDPVSDTSETVRIAIGAAPALMSDLSISPSELDCNLYESCGSETTTDKHLLTNNGRAALSIVQNIIDRHIIPLPLYLTGDSRQTVAVIAVIHGEYSGAENETGLKDSWLDRRDFYCAGHHCRDLRDEGWREFDRRAEPASSG